MFEFGRELKRLFGADKAKASSRGLTGGDAALLELLDLQLLTREGRTADIAAGQAPARDRAQQRLDAAIVWREVARRSGDPASLRKAAAGAEAAATSIDRTRNPDAWARARAEQAFCALLGAELFGDEGLNAAAETALREARAVARGGVASPLADVGLALIKGREGLAKGDADAAREAAARFNAPIAALDALTRRCGDARRLAAEARLTRADLLCGWGARLKDESLLKIALEDASGAAAKLDAAYEPLTWSRAEILRGQALTLWGETSGDLDALSAGVTALAGALDNLTREHSPMDWARTQLALAQALQALGEACDDERAFEQAVTCYDRAHVVLKDASATTVRGAAAGARAVCLARSAELTGDLAVLDAAEASMKIELATLHARRDPVGWALAQVHLARLYEARLDITGKDRGERSKALISLEAAVDVFAEEGLHGLSLIARDAMQRLRADVTPERKTV